MTEWVTYLERMRFFGQDTIRPMFDIAVSLATGDSRLFEARHLATTPDCRIVWQLSEMACPEECRITSCQCNRNVKHGPVGLVS